MAEALMEAIWMDGLDELVPYSVQTCEPCPQYRMVHDQVLHDAPSSKRCARMKKDIMVNVTGDMGEMVWESLMEKEKERRKVGP